MSTGYSWECLGSTPPLGVRTVSLKNLNQDAFSYDYPVKKRVNHYYRKWGCDENFDGEREKLKSKELKSHTCACPQDCGRVHIWNGMPTCTILSTHPSLSFCPNSDPRPLRKPPTYHVLKNIHWFSQCDDMLSWNSNVPTNHMDEKNKRNPITLMRYNVWKHV